MTARSHQRRCRHRFVPELVHDFGWSASWVLANRWTPVGQWRVYERCSAQNKPGPPLVFVHGLVISSLYFIPLAECLAPFFNVRLPDQPGFGRSEGPPIAPTVPEMADLMIRWLDAAEIDCCHLVANSLGCQIATAMAVQAPERIQAMVLIGPTVYPRARGFWNQTARIVWDAPHEPLQLWMNHLLDQYRAGCRRIWGMIFNMLEDRIETRLRQIQQPVLVLRGRKDPSAPENWVREVARHLPRGEARTLPGWHCVHYTHPEATAQVIREYIENLSPARLDV